MFEKIIAKEGKFFILGTFLVFIFFYLFNCNFLASVSFLVLVFFLFLYRMKNIDINTLKKNEIYSPISGKISSIDSGDLKKIITIDVSLCDLHILRNLEEGKVKITQKKGLNLPLTTYKAKKLNEQTLLEYDNLSMRLVSSLFNPVINIRENSKKGEKIGIFFQGQVIITLDKNMQTQVKLGEKLISGKTILAIYQ